jgi:hypothetical protein
MNMKKTVLFIIALFMVSGIFAENPSTKKIEVYYFHFTRRCMTCNNVEKVSKEAVEHQYAEKLKTGEITFKSINLDEKEGEVIGAKYKIEGQTLIVISGDKRVDLTDKGFLYANNSPEKLKAEIKKAVDGMLK